MWLTLLLLLLIAQSCLTLCDPVDYSTPGFPVLHHLPEFAQIPVHWVGDAIQPSRPLLPLLLCPQSFPASGSFPVVLWYPSKSDQGWLCQKLHKPQNLSHSPHASLSALSPSSYHPHPLVGAGGIWGNAFTGELTVWCLCSPLSWELSTPHLERKKKKSCRIGVFWVYFPEFWSISGLHVISRAPHPSLFVLFWIFWPVFMRAG